MSGRDLKNWIANAEQQAIARAADKGGTEHFVLKLRDLENTQTAGA